MKLINFSAITMSQQFFVAKSASEANLLQENPGTALDG